MSQENPLSHTWTMPQPVAERQLKLYNSLTRRKDPFVPINGNSVTWYVCGPTVYDVAHMGHARAYVCFDILRRVMRDYFGYDVFYVMNITDIDDKIIKRARQRRLLADYVDSALDHDQLIRDIESAQALYETLISTEDVEEKRSLYQTTLDKSTSALCKLRSTAAAKEEALRECADILANWLDANGDYSSIDHSTFTALSRHYEEEFNKDMIELNVLPPDVVTRVSEYVPEIIKFIDTIMGRGFAYEANGSVYFDTTAYRQSGRHHYGKLVPEAVADPLLLQRGMREGEGELSYGGSEQQEKRSSSDFALWKATKPGEPVWPSPWGDGRPGWHIECSAMATAVFGDELDVHAGGFDLRFPHHDNELAQTEAHYDRAQWVNYFLHAGTLKIAGMKMSKSLKNFITIKQALREYSARQLRLLFLMHDWTDPLDYGRQTMERAVHFERLCNEFFLTVGHYLRKHYDGHSSASFQKFAAVELELLGEFRRCKATIDDALCDNINTRLVLDTIRDCVGVFNGYILKQEAAARTPCSLLLRTVAVYITKLLRIFGVVGSNEEIGLGEKDADATALDKESLLMPYLNVLCDFRRKVRDEAKSHGVASLLDECDRVRDDVLPNLGVRLEDRKSDTVVKLVDREALLKEREQKARLELEKLSRKQQLSRAAEAKRTDKMQQASVAPSELFKATDGDKYSKFDELGIPTHDASGKEISASQRKKLKKRYEAHKLLYERYKNGT